MRSTGERKDGTVAGRARSSEDISAIMRKVQSTRTAPESRFSAILAEYGLMIETNRSDLPGKPDITPRRTVGGLSARTPPTSRRRRPGGCRRRRRARRAPGRAVPAASSQIKGASGPKVKAILARYGETRRFVVSCSPNRRPSRKWTCLRQSYPAKQAQQGAPAAVLPPLRCGKTAAELGRSAASIVNPVCFYV